MTNQETIAQMLESLIKMVGKGNQRMDSLQKRICQLECAIREQEPLEAGGEIGFSEATTGAPSEAH